MCRRTQGTYITEGHGGVDSIKRKAMIVVFRWCRSHGGQQKSARSSGGHKRALHKHTHFLAGGGSYHLFMRTIIRTNSRRKVRTQKTICTNQIFNIRSNFCGTPVSVRAPHPELSLHGNHGSKQEQCQSRSAGFSKRRTSAKGKLLISRDRCWTSHSPETSCWVTSISSSRAWAETQPARRLQG